MIAPSLDNLHNGSLQIKLRQLEVLFTLEDVICVQQKLEDRTLAAP